MKNKQTVLLTGATGFLGSHLLEALLAENYKVIILKRSTSDAWRIQHLLEQVRSYDVDRQGLELAFIDQRIDTVIHTACSYGRKGESIAEVVETNLTLGLKLMQYSISHSTGVFVNTDTFFNKVELSSYMADYRLSKRQMHEWLDLKRAKIKIINMRLEHVYGVKDADDKFIKRICTCFYNNNSVLNLTECKQLRDFIYIDDAVSAYLVILKNHSEIPSGMEFEVGTGVLVSVKEFVLNIYKSIKKLQPNLHTVINFGANAERPGEIDVSCANNKPLRGLGWRPIFNIKNGVEKLLESNTK